MPAVLLAPTSSEGKGWYETGGILHIVGRVKRFIKIAGEMVSLEAVEELAAATSPEQLRADSSQPDTRKGEALVPEC